MGQQRILLRIWHLVMAKAASEGRARAWEGIRWKGGRVDPNSN